MQLLGTLPHELKKQCASAPLFHKVTESMYSYGMLCGNKNDFRLFGVSSLK